MGTCDHESPWCKYTFDVGSSDQPYLRFTAFILERLSGCSLFDANNRVRRRRSDYEKVSSDGCGRHLFVVLHRYGGHGPRKSKSGEGENQPRVKGERTRPCAGAV